MIAIGLSIIVPPVAVWFLSRRFLHAIPVLMVMCGFETISYRYLGVPFNLAEVALMMIAAMTLGHLLVRRKQLPRSVVPIAGLILFVALLPLAVGQAYMSTVNTAHYGFFQQPGVRVALVAFQRVLMVVLLFMPYVYDPSVRAKLPGLVVAGYLLGSTVQAMFALYELAAQGTGLPPLLAAEAAPLSLEYYRVAAFSGEPRHLAMLLAPSIIVLLLQRFLLVRPQGFLHSPLNLILHIAAFLPTYSTSGAFIFALAVPYLWVLIWIRKRSLAAGFKMIVVSGTGILLVGLLIDPNLIHERIFERANIDVVFRSEFNTAASIELLVKQPLVALTGIGLGLPPYLLKGMDAYDAAFGSTLYDPTYFIRNPPGLVLIILESGILGAALLMWLFVSLSRRIRRSEPHVAVLAVLLLGLFFVGIVGAAPLTSPFFCALAVYLASVRQYRRARWTSTSAATCRQSDGIEVTDVPIRNFW